MKYNSFIFILINFLFSSIEPFSIFFSVYFNIDTFYIIVLFGQLVLFTSFLSFFRIAINYNKIFCFHNSRNNLRGSDFR